MIRIVALVTFLAFTSFYAYALEIQGVIKQGGLLAITYDGDNTKNISINKKKLDIQRDGLVYYPIHRNAKKLYITQELNNGTLSKKVLKVESQDYAVQNVKGVKSKHVTPDKSFLARIRKESAEIKKSRRYNSLKFFNTVLPEFNSPLEGRVTGVFGSKRLYNGIEKSWHKGLDIAQKEKTPIFAALKGKVVLAMKDSFYNGNLVIIDHGKKIYTIYAHMYDILVKQGDLVGPKDVIGLVGSTGRSTGPHLHWGVYVAQQAIDPELLLKKGR